MLSNLKMHPKAYLKNWTSGRDPCIPSLDIKPSSQTDTAMGRSSAKQIDSSAVQKLAARTSCWRLPNWACCVVCDKVVDPLNDSILNTLPISDRIRGVQLIQGRVSNPSAVHKQDGSDVPSQSAHLSNADTIDTAVRAR